jgi:hypothetical protein
MASVLTRAIGRRGDKDVVLVDKDGNVVEKPKADRPAKVSTDDLDAVTNAPRLKGPGAKLAKASEPNFDKKVTGRARR